MKADTMGNSEIPGYIPPWVSGGGGVGGHVIDPNDQIGDGGGYYDFSPAPSPTANNTPQTMAEALSPAPVVTVTDDTMKINIDQPTLIVGILVAVGLFIFAAK